MTTRILVAEPEPHVRRILRFILEAAGHEVRTAAAGEEAWLLLASFRPDLVLVGTHLPGIDGLTLVDSMRAKPGFVATPVMILTADRHAEARTRALAAGANDAMVKPFNHEELVLRVANLLRNTVVQRRAGALGTAGVTEGADVLEPVCS
jgi:DNA-binding response OmpR family regulator